MTGPSLFETVGSLYDAALDTALWPTALGNITRALDGQAFSLFLLDKRTAEVPLMSSFGLSPEFLREFKGYYTALEPALPFLSATPRLPFYLDQMWIDERAIDRHEFYAWLERAGGVRYRLGGVIAETPDHYGLTALLRSRRRGQAGAAEQKLFLRLLPHNRRATRIWLELGQLEGDSTVRHEALDRLSIGVLLLDQLGRLILSNRAARAILDQDDGLGLDGAGRLRAAFPGETQALRRTIAAVSATAAGADLHAGRGHGITRPSGRRSYLAFIAPLGDRRDALGLERAPAAVVLLTDPDQTGCAPIDLLRRSYGLTAAEARLAGDLAEGLRVEEAAAKHGVTIGTARSHLKAVFAKTGTRSQSALVRLLLSAQSGPTPGDRQ